MSRVKRVFISIPASPEYKRIRETIVRVLRDHNLEPLTVEFVAGMDIYWHVARAIEQADLVIVDISSANPNVSYELGYAHASKIPVLPMVQLNAERDVRFDLRPSRYLVYDPENMEELRKRLELTLAGYLLSEAEVQGSE